MIKYSIVIPVFNEEPVIQEFYSRLKKVMDSTNENYELIFINDGSYDSTGELVKNFAKKDSKVKLLNFSRNFGHQIAISAGLDYASGDATVIIDADLQDPPEIIIEMIKKWKEGYEVVYGKRIKRKGETFFKKFTAFVFYRLLKNLTSFDIPVDTGDFRLIDKKICNIIKGLSEKSRYLRGLISWMGFKQTSVEYIRDERHAGYTKYYLRNLLKLALDGITSFSYKPLKLAYYFGFGLSGFSFLYLLILIYQKLFIKTTIPGWSSVIAVILFFNGIILIILGIIGEYIGRIYEETKGRPLYILRDKVGFGS
ncbi:MAG: glycosyltransferase [Candidatus Melainabacteria bacterium RIFCSPHIGHO2_02_FULL_34_12]|nr:MAG: glycosyltransferase [Candidatus Melainabacteria bacterium RIFCSPHIGHO2_02_FULL_34_12]